MIRKSFLFFLLSLLISTNSFANASIPEDSFNQLNECVHKKNLQGCRDLVTASSSSLYARFISYGVTSCLPKNAEYVSEQDMGEQVVILASVTDNGKRRYGRLVFVEEGEGWKLDIPESLRMAMGKNWQEQLNFVEKIYLVMREDFGKKLKIDCQVLRQLVKKE